jgi:tRNA dimethylallyltransferase
VTAPIVAVVGPTAVGKSAIALRIANEVGGEIVNADAMQLYAGMDVGTAKVPVVERVSIPHHIFDIWPVTFPASVVDYQGRAVEAVHEILGRGNVPVVVGGSGLYVRALLDDLRIPPTDPEVRRRLEAEIAEVGPQPLHDRLQLQDPTAAAAILPSNSRRIVRALEVVELTGSFSATLPDGRYRWPDTIQIGLDTNSEQLDHRIAVRVQEMFDAGLVREVADLEQVGLRGSPTASKALGYAQILAAIAEAERTGAEPDIAGAREATVVATRRFVRRQRSWFRRDSRIRWFDQADQAVSDALEALSRNR